MSDVSLATLRESRLGELDRAVDHVPAAPGLADELFAVVDLLDSEPSLRRALTDPARGAAARRQLVTTLLGSRVGESTLAVVNEAVALRWASGRSLAAALERQAVRAAVRQSLTDGAGDGVEQELFAVRQLVERNHELRDALGDTSAPIALRRQLVDGLVGSRVSPVTRQLVDRAVAARERTMALTLDHYLALAAQLRQRRIAHVTVAAPLTAEQDARLRAALTRQAGHAVDLQVEVDPAVIGGVRVVMGDEVIEGTVAGRLEDVRRQLV